MELLFLGFAIGVVTFGIGVEVGHRLTARAYRKRVCKIKTAEDHRREAARLIHESMKTPDSDYVAYLRDQAFQHYVQADKLDYGPYKTDTASLEAIAHKVAA